LITRRSGRRKFGSVEWSYGTSGSTSSRVSLIGLRSEKIEDGPRAERVEALMDKKKRLLKELKVKVREVALEVEIIEAEYSQYFPSFHRGPEDNADEVPPPNKWNAYNN
jgi:hypothetical protein